jgi:hypothetical protein
MKIKVLFNTFMLVAIEGLLIPCNSQTMNGENPEQSRFSVSFGGGYHFNSWSDFNNAMETFGEYLRYIPYYGDPKGTYETIGGDIFAEGSLNYRILENTDLFIGGAYTKTGSKSDVTYVRTSSGQNSTNRFKEELGFAVVGLDAGVRYNFEISGVITLLITGGAGLAFGRMTFRHEFGGDIIEVYDAELRQTTAEGKIGVSFGIRLAQPVLLLLSTEYRYLAFNNMKGPATYLLRYSNGYEQKKSYEARLLSTKGYFGISDQDGSPIARPWSDIREYGSLRYALVDLTSFGLTLGIEVEL